MNVGENIRLYRQRAHLTQSELGKKVGVTKSQISRYEKSQIKKVPLEIKLDIARVLGCSIEELCNDREVKSLNGQPMEMKAWAVRFKNIKSGVQRVAWVNLNYDSTKRLCHDYYDGVIDETKEKYEIIPCKVVFEK